MTPAGPRPSALGARLHRVLSLGIVMLAVFTLPARADGTTATASPKAANSANPLMIAPDGYAEYNLSVPDTSPMLQYAPSDSGASDVTWNQTYSRTSWSEWKGENTTFFPDGDSAHFTTSAGATVSIEFVGTGVAFWGSAQGQVSYKIDNQPDTPKDVNISNGLIATTSQLGYGHHVVTLKLISGSISLAKAEVTYAVGGQGATTSNSTLVSLVTGTKDLPVNPSISTSGPGWQTASSACADGTGGEFKCLGTVYRMQTGSTGAWMEFSPPENTSLVVMYGSVGADYGTYRVSIDPPPYRGPAKFDYNGRAPWTNVNAITFVASLDPSQKYKVKAEYTDKPGLFFDFRQADFITVSGGEGGLPNNSTSEYVPPVSGDSGKSSSKAAIIGGAVGGAVAAVILIVLLLFWLHVRRRNERQKAAAHGKRRAVGHLLDPNRPPSAASVHSEFAIDSNEDHISPMIMNSSSGILPGVPSRPSEAHIAPFPMKSSQGDDLSTEPPPTFYNNHFASATETHSKLSTEPRSPMSKAALSTADSAATPPSSTGIDFSRAADESVSSNVQPPPPVVTIDGRPVDTKSHAFTAGAMASQQSLPLSTKLRSAALASQQSLPLSAHSSSGASGPHWKIPPAPNQRPGSSYPPSLISSHHSGLTSAHHVAMAQGAQGVHKMSPLNMSQPQYYANLNHTAYNSFATDMAPPVTAAASSAQMSYKHPSHSTTSFASTIPSLHHMPVIMGSPRVTEEEDAGPLEGETVPPRYNPAWRQ